jgi:hypothetical protein
MAASDLKLMDCLLHQKERFEATAGDANGHAERHLQHGQADQNRPPDMIPSGGSMSRERRHCEPEGIDDGYVGK